MNGNDWCMLRSCIRIVGMFIGLHINKKPSGKLLTMQQLCNTTRY